MKLPCYPGTDSLIDTSGRYDLSTPGTGALPLRSMRVG